MSHWTNGWSHFAAPGRGQKIAQSVACVTCFCPPQTLLPLYENCIHLFTGLLLVQKVSLARVDTVDRDDPKVPVDDSSEHSVERHAIDEPVAVVGVEHVPQARAEIMLKLDAPHVPCVLSIMLVLKGVKMLVW